MTFDLIDRVRHIFSSLTAAFALAVSALVALAQTAPQYTFSQDIAPLACNHCTRCHRTGEVAPFPPTTEVASHAQTINYMTGTRYIPLWKPDPCYCH